MTWTPKYRKPFQTWLPNVSHVAYNDIEVAREAINGETAAVVVEAIQGEGGVHPASVEYLGALRERCDQVGAMLIMDEIQTGLGRTGRWFGVEHADIVPDIVAIGKAIGGGIPMGVVAWRSAYGPIERASHGSTFGGNPLACAAGIATLTTIRDEELVERARDNGDWLLKQLSELQLKAVREVRGRGLMIGLELRGRVTPVLKALQEGGVLALPAGLNVLRLLPPLTINREQLQFLVNAIAEVLD